jgi:hypothetical protein
MDESQTLCPVHGREGIGLVCEHIAFAVERGERVGFYRGDDTDTARPDAWCRECEAALRALDGASSEQCSEMLVSRSSAPNAGMRLSLSVVGFRNRSVQHGQLSDGIVPGRWRCEGCCCRLGLFLAIERP